ncbi:hypothetical protein [Methylomonas sp. HYX-M1]|uniref:hypothetical protein n=1 Tax=Methylomonas sp. HYX-M1 TaxID=3139307 RepID=UPI00345C00C5
MAACLWIHSQLPVIARRLLYPSSSSSIASLGAFTEQLTTWLETARPYRAKKRKRTVQRLYECLQVEDYVGGYSAVPRFVKTWKASRSASPAIKQAFVPLLFPAGETCQFDWSHENWKLFKAV